VDNAIGWQRLEALVGETETVLAGTREDNLSEVIGRYPVVRRIVPVLLGAFAFRSWKTADPLLAALNLLRGIYASEARKLPERVPTAFLTSVWRKLIGGGAAVDRRAYEVAVMVVLRDRLRAGDIWVEGSRAFRAFDEFLLPRAVFLARRQEGGLGLAVPDRFEVPRSEGHGGGDLVGAIGVVSAHRTDREACFGDVEHPGAIDHAFLVLMVGPAEHAAKHTAGPGLPTGSDICVLARRPETVLR
jgi:hypothetical protein